ncbi:excinuclease ABC subunit A [Muribaculum sp. An289]|uniref:excinuclease ABC subunit UvrA n=1 Tax=unclassified Muribaculum TaxID=2622126 RepID=UPI000B37053F|nr:MULTISPECIES: excinuclease ABC subunit UvrA [unclassified Muribaculum]OUO36525.1 excinuclease ABC subunit A [Muribaculum sp. An289]OUO42257.1 excinuclease ABC subunit A [Muribaculum sp. An287]
MDNSIKITGAKAHNLKNVSLEIPRDRLVVVTGLSGSGKSSLAFDTIFAEGQRRYMDTLSVYAKQFMGILEKPDVEEIEGLSPIIAIEQKTTGNNPRSTVGTTTEIYDFLRLLYAKASEAYSPVTGKKMVKYSDSQIVSLIIERYKGKKCVLLSPLVKGRKGHYRELISSLRKKGFNEARIDGEIVLLEEVQPLDRYKPHFIELVIDKLKPKDEDEKRIRESVTTALAQGKGELAVMNPEDGKMQYFSKHLVCPDSGISLPEPAPHTFSFNSPRGYCPNCKGLGRIRNIQIDSIIPDKSKSIADGGIIPLGKSRENKKFDVVRAIAQKYGFSLFDPIDEIPQDALSLLIYGSDELFRIGSGANSEMVTFKGVMDDVTETVECPVCHGKRLNEESLLFRIDGKNIYEVSQMEISELQKWLRSLPEKLSARQSTIARDILKELNDRVGFLMDVGLEYLTLSRPASSLSGGESQRIRLATQIGSKLVNVLYILDEPSIGLHYRDNRKLIDSLKKLRDEGNSVMVVEHDREMMENADWLIDMGPGAGELGGEVLYNGPVSGIKGISTPTLDYLNGLKNIDIPPARRKGNGTFLNLRGARGNNLKNVDISIPLGCFVGISGVSGSGKSTLITETLMPVLSNIFYRSSLTAQPYDEITGVENIDKLVEIDQSPIGKTARSNPATYTDVFTDIRKLFEETPDAKIRGFKSGRFSFNVSGGRCEECKGAGIKVIEMNFLPSVNVTCPQCGGKRYNPDTLAVKYKGKNISDVLEMPVSEAYGFFRNIPSIAYKLQALCDVGLGYIRLGQSSVTLSGGESQRIKLAAEFSRKATGNTLYILDEPTTGLHFDDIKILLNVLQKLVDQGNTVIIIEHNLDILKSVDYIFDLGPEGGEKGGRIVAEGTPEEIAGNPESVTGPYLKEALNI